MLYNLILRYSKFGKVTEFPNIPKCGFNYVVQETDWWYITPTTHMSKYAYVVIKVNNLKYNLVYDLSFLTAFKEAVHQLSGNLWQKFKCHIIKMTFSISQVACFFGSSKLGFQTNLNVYAAAYM